MADRPELVPVPTSSVANVFEIHRRIGLGSIDPSGRIRLDAIADLLQDVATEHDECEGDPDHGIWVLRRLTVVVTGRRPRYGERVRLRTFCGGLGSRWAERRTSIAGSEGVGIECAAIWVRVSPAGRPALLTERFIERHVPTTAGRVVSARRTHGDPTESAASTRWAVRRVDLDTMGHVNNAAHWRAVEEILDGRPYEIAEIEYRDELVRTSQPITLLSDEHDSILSTWLVADGRVRSSARIALRSHGRPDVGHGLARRATP